MSDEFVILENNLCENGLMNVWIQFMPSNLDTKLYFMLIGCPGTLNSKNKPTCDVYDIFYKSCKSYRVSHKIPNANSALNLKPLENNYACSMH